MSTLFFSWLKDVFVLVAENQLNIDLQISNTSSRLSIVSLESKVPSEEKIGLYESNRLTLKICTVQVHG